MSTMKNDDDDDDDDFNKKKLANAKPTMAAKANKQPPKVTVVATVAVKAKTHNTKTNNIAANKKQTKQITHVHPIRKNKP